MTRRNVCTVIAAGFLTCGLVAMTPASGWAQQTSVLPEQGARVTLYGCFTTETFEGHSHDAFVLLNPAIGSPVSAPEASCPATNVTEKIELKDVHEQAHKHHLDRSLTGRWIVVSGRIESLSPGEIRELHVMSYRVLPAAGEPQTSALPEKGGRITLFGCFATETFEGHSHDAFVLRNPEIGTPKSVPEADCTASTASAERIELKDVHENVHKHHLDRSKVGRWIEVTGRLESLSPGEVRELHVMSYREVPVVVPRVAEAQPAPEPPPAAEPLAAAPVSAAPIVGTTGVEELPKTASPVPLTALIGLFALIAGLALRLVVRRRTL